MRYANDVVVLCDLSIEKAGEGKREKIEQKRRREEKEKRGEKNIIKHRIYVYILSTRATKKMKQSKKRLHYSAEKAKHLPILFVKRQELFLRYSWKNTQARPTKAKPQSAE